MEIWKDVPNYNGVYQVSNLGNVKSLRYSKEKQLTKTIDSTGYMKCGLTKDGKLKNIRVHQLVAMAFLNHFSNGNRSIVVDHIDNNKLNNKLENLQLITSRKNASKDKKGVSKYTGVCWFNRDKKWKAQIYKNGKQTHLGYFDTEIEAYKIYKKELNKITNTASI